jgi:hypothetical protein
MERRGKGNEANATSYSLGRVSSPPTMGLPDCQFRLLMPFYALLYLCAQRIAAADAPDSPPGNDLFMREARPLLEMDEMKFPWDM